MPIFLKSRNLNFLEPSGPVQACKGRFTHSMPFPCRAHAVPLPCRAAKGLEFAFPIWFTQCGRVWFTLSMPCPCHAPTMPFFSRPQHGRLSTAMLCNGLEKNGMVGAWHGNGMASVNQTRPHCVNQMGKTHYKPLAARHGTAGERHGRGMGTECYVWIGLHTSGSYTLRCNNLYRM